MAEPAIAEMATDRVIRIANPISKDMGALRTSLVPGMVAIVRNNVSHGNKDLRLFEFGTSYLIAGNGEKGKYLEGYIEREELILVFSGAASPHAWDQKTRQVDLFDVKGELETLFAKIFLDKINFIPYSNGNTLTQPGLTIDIQGESAGSLGAVRKEIRQRFDLDSELLVAVLDLEVLRTHMAAQRRYVPLPRYPSVHRDVAFVVDKSVPVGKIESCIRESVAGVSLKVELFDVYVGNQIPDAKKSCAFSLEFLSRDHTLGQAEIDKVMEAVIGNVSKMFQASIRA
jgi:phenylalanyl-tRNA synthetase beta chain